MVIRGHSEGLEDTEMARYSSSKKTRYTFLRKCTGEEFQRKHLQAISGARSIQEYVVSRSYCFLQTSPQIHWPHFRASETSNLVGITEKVEANSVNQT